MRIWRGYEFFSNPLCIMWLIPFCFSTYLNGRGSKWCLSRHDISARLVQKCHSCLWLIFTELRSGPKLPANDLLCELRDVVTFFFFGFKTPQSKLWSCDFVVQVWGYLRWIRCSTSFKEWLLSKWHLERASENVTPPLVCPRPEALRRGREGESQERSVIQLVT